MSALRIRCKRKHWPICKGTVLRNRLFTQQDLVLIRRMIAQHPGWGRTKLSTTIAETLNWRQSNGRLKDRACRVALVRLESFGLLKLPRKQVENGGKPPAVLRDPPEQAKQCVDQMPREIRCALVKDRAEANLWNNLIGHFHYLGVATPVGRLLRYLIYGDDSLLGAISFGEPAWNIRIRNSLLDEVGLDATERAKSLVGNNRYLILPNVRVPNLASRVLAESLRTMRNDWADRYSVSPLVVETFVDPRRFEGTCYRAANWLHIGNTKGFAKRGDCHSNRQAPKLMFLKGLTPLIQRRLISNVVECANRAARQRAA